MRYHPDANPYLAASSLFFLLPAVQAFASCDTRTGILNTTIILTSVVFHLHRTDLSYWMDQGAIGALVGNALWIAWHQDLPYFFILLLAGTYNTGIYYQGRKWRETNSLSISTLTHASIHAVAALSGYGLRSRLGSLC